MYVPIMMWGPANIQIDQMSYMWSFLSRSLQLPLKTQADPFLDTVC